MGRGEGTTRDEGHDCTFCGMVAVARVHAAILVLGRTADQHRVIGMGLDVLLEILGTLERLAAKVALVRLQRDVDTDVRGDVVPLDRGGPARVPLAGEVQVVGALAANMFFTNMFLGYC